MPISDTLEDWHRRTGRVATDFPHQAGHDLDTFETKVMALPAGLLEAVCHPAGGRVVIVLGAGCSFEAPTNLLLSSQCAEAAHTRLVEDGILTHGECADPDDLSVVADAVWGARGRQRELVERLPVDAFRLAKPNEGYVLAAALLYERAVSCIMTLNFDLAMSHAMESLGVRGVSIVEGPADHQDLGLVNLIYLHRNVNADFEDWILRTVALNEQWRDGWEGVIVARVLATPVTVFAGLGTPSGVLIETTTRIRRVVSDAHMAVYQVDPLERARSVFFEALGIPDDAYLQMGWNEFMRQVSNAVVAAQTANLNNACMELLAAEHWPPEETAELCQRLAVLGLIAFGRARARWLLTDLPYLPGHEVDLHLLADLVLAVALLERLVEGQAHFTEDGVVEIRTGSRLRAVVILASGRGVRRWLSLEAEVRGAQHYWQYREPRPRYVIAAGIQGGRPDAISTPKSLLREDDPTSIVPGDTGLEILAVDEFRADPTRVQQILD